MSTEVAGQLFAAEHLCCFKTSSVAESGSCLAHLLKQLAANKIVFSANTLLQGVAIPSYCEATYKQEILNTNPIIQRIN